MLLLSLVVNDIINIILQFAFKYMNNNYFFVNLKFSKIENLTFLENDHFFIKKLLLFEHRDFFEKKSKNWVNFYP